MTPISIVAFVGYSGSGKTTLIERLIPVLTKRNLRIAVVKHDAHEIDIDREGKDSWRFTRAGAIVSAISSAGKSGIIENRSLSFHDIIARISCVDLILVEGYKNEDIPKIGLERKAAGISLPDTVSGYIAIVTDAPDPAGSLSIPAFTHDDIERIADFVVAFYTQGKLSADTLCAIQASGETPGTLCGAAHCTEEEVHRPDFSHFNAAGKPRMVNVGDKNETQREATAACRVLLSEETFELVRTGGIKKGNVLDIAHIAGIMGAKQTASLIPMCHPLAIDAVDLSVSLCEAHTCVDIAATVRCTGRTGVEMEALTAVTTAALTVYDMCKAVQRDIEITNIRLLEKTGGTHGDYIRKEERL